MFLREDGHGVVEHEHVVHRALLGALAFVVDDARFGQVPVLVAARGDAVAQIDILAIHEETFVQEAHFVERSFPQEHARTGKDLDRRGLVLLQVTKVVAAEHLALGEQAREADDLVERHCRCRQSAFAFRQELARSIDHFHTQPTYFRMSVHKGDHLVENILPNDRIRVQQNHVLGIAFAYRLVIRPAEAHVILVGDEAHLRKFFTDHFHTAIRALVIYHEDVTFNAFQCFEYRSKTLLEVRSNIIVYDDDGELHVWLFVVRWWLLVVAEQPSTINYLLTPCS